MYGYKNERLGIRQRVRLYYANTSLPSLRRVQRIKLHSFMDILSVRVHTYWYLPIQYRALTSWCTSMYVNHIIDEEFFIQKKRLPTSVS